MKSVKNTIKQAMHIHKVIRRKANVCFPSDTLALLQLYKVLENKEETQLLTADEKNQIMNKLRKFCVALVGVFTVGAIANFGRVYLMRMISQRIAARIRHSFYSSTGT